MAPRILFAAPSSEKGVIVNNQDDHDDEGDEGAPEDKGMWRLYVFIATLAALSFLVTVTPKFA